MNDAESSEPVHISIVVPVRNEQDNIEPLLNEIEAALAELTPYEVIYVNDGSTDRTAETIDRLRQSRPALRHIRHSVSCGQSAAVRSGVRAAQGEIIATLDGDGQNDPAFIPQMAALLLANGENCGLVQGQRVGRQDTGFKKFQSRVANGVRARILRDGTRDTGCGLKCFRREAYLALPYFDALHRFMPALIRREGYELGYVDVKDRPRNAGVSNYGFFDRLWVGMVDLCGVRWLISRRKKTPQAQEQK